MNLDYVAFTKLDRDCRTPWETVLVISGPRRTVHMANWTATPTRVISAHIIRQRLADYGINTEAVA